MRFIFKTKTAKTTQITLVNKDFVQDMLLGEDFFMLIPIWAQRFSVTYGFLRTTGLIGVSRGFQQINYVRGEVIFKAQRLNITPFLRQCYKLYFDCPLDDQDKE